MQGERGKWEEGLARMLNAERGRLAPWPAEDGTILDDFAEAAAVIGRGRRLEEKGT